MKIAITGASGFIGTETVNLFTEHKIEFEKLSRGERAGFRKTDYSVESLTEIFSGVDAVVHLAAIRGGTSGIGYSAFRENEILTENVLKAMAQAGVKKIIYLSSISVYSDTAQLPWSETQAVVPVNFYGLSKLMGEQLCNLYRKDGIQATIFRCAHVFGFEDSRYMISVFFRGAAAHDRLSVRGKSVAKREFVYVKDVARALLWAVQNQEISGTFNLGTGKGHTNLEVATAINRAFENEGNLEYQDSVKETIQPSYMDVGKLTQAGFQTRYSLDEAALDVRKDKFCEAV